MKHCLVVCLLIVLLLWGGSLLAEYPLGTYTYLQPTSSYAGALCNIMKNMGYNSSIVEIRNHDGAQISNFFNTLLHKTLTP